MAWLTNYDLEKLQPGMPLDTQMTRPVRMPLKNRGLRPRGQFTKNLTPGSGRPKQARRRFRMTALGHARSCRRESAADMGEADALSALGGPRTDTPERDLAWNEPTGQPSEAGTERERMNPQPGQSWFQEASGRGYNRLGPQSGKPTAGL